MEGEKAKMKIPFRKNPAVSITKSAYAMASSDGVSAEITLYGDIYESQPTDWWGDPVEGQFITLTEFLEDLKQIEGCKNVTVRMNSYGGDAGVSNTIHNRLRELSRNGVAITCIVDGVAMSGGSIIMCACDTVKANPSSLIMIHKCWSYLHDRP
jgi:ClpP class serine protease